jgi:hypothetical protein
MGLPFRWIKMNLYVQKGQKTNLVLNPFAGIIYSHASRNTRIRLLHSVWFLSVPYLSEHGAVSTISSLAQESTINQELRNAISIAARL